MAHTTPGSVTIITAATRGMGRACAMELARRGHQLILLARSAEVHPLAEQLGGIGIEGDVSRAADLTRTVETARSTHGRIDAVVNNTGHPPKGDLLEIADEEWHAGLDLLLLNVVRMSRLVTPVMTQLGGGSIVNISSFGAREPQLAFPVSSALRASLSAFTKLFATRYGPANIRMNNVLPGFVDSYPVEPVDLEATPLGRAGHTAEIASTVAFLLSSDAGFITGQDILVDGGLVQGL